MDSTFSFAANANVSALLIETAMCGSGTKLEEQMTAEDFFCVCKRKVKFALMEKEITPSPSVYVRKKRKCSPGQNHEKLWKQGN